MTSSRDNRPSAGAAATARDEDPFRQLFDRSAAGVYRTTLDGRFLDCNPSTVQMFGYHSREELLKVPVAELFFDPAQRRSMIEAACANRTTSSELKLRRKDGTPVWVLENMTFIPSAAHSGEGCLEGTLVDITDLKIAEDRLRASEERYREVLDNATDIIYTHDLSGNYTYVNKACAAISGYTVDELLQMNTADTVAPEYLPLTREAIRQKLAGNIEPAPYEIEVVTKSGSRRTVEISSRLVLEDGKPVAIQGIGRDVTGRKRADALQKALYRISYEAYHAEDLQKLYASIHHIVSELMYAKNFYIALFDPDTGIASFPYFEDEREQRPTPRKLTRGLTEYVVRTGQPFLARLENIDELVAMGVIERFGAPSLDWLGVPLKKGELVMGVLAVQTYTEDIRYGEKEKEILTFVSQHIAAAVQRKQAEQAMRESESKFRAVAETAATLIYIYDGSGFLYVNRASEEVTGYTRQELMKMEPFQMVHPDFRPVLIQHAKARLEGRSAPPRYEFKIINKQGDERWLDFSAGMIEFAGKRAILGTAVDTTERKRAELLQSALYRIAEETRTQSDLQKFYAAIHRIVGELMYVRNFYIALYDQKSNSIKFVYAVDEVDTYPPPDVPMPLPKGSLTEYVLRSGKPLFAPLERFNEMVKEGKVKSVGAPSIDWLGVPLRQGDETFGVLTVQTYNENVRYTPRDAEVLTFVSQHLATAIEHQRSQEAMRESEQRYRTLVQGAVYGIYRSTVDNRFLDVNPALVEMLGYSSTAELLALNIERDLYLDSEDRHRLLAEYRRNRRVSNLEVRWKRRDGNPITVRLSGRALLSAEGEVESFEMIAEDVTERRALEEQLRQSQKMEAVGKLAGGVAHDFNNLLTIIKGNCELLMETAEQNAEPELQEIRKASERAAALTRQLLAFSRQQVLDPKILDLNAVVGNMNKMLRRLLGEDVELITRLGDGLGSVKADPGQLEQVVMNLAVNARDAMPTGGTLTIETQNITLKPDAASSDGSSTLRGENFVMLTVADNGQGMDAATRSRIFEPFFTTKELGKGTGLGLSTVYGIVKQSGGHVEVESVEGAGTRMSIYLPRVDEVAEVMYMPATARPVGYGNETVLLVEDEDGLRALIRKVLSKKGYTVLPARDAGEALLLCEKATEPIHLLLTDVVLPKMGGHQLAQAVLKASPMTKVLYMSGYTDETIVHHGILDPDVDFLQKPFTSDALAIKVREVLDHGAAVKRATSGMGPRLV